MNRLEDAVGHAQVLFAAPPKSRRTPIHFILDLWKKDFQSIEKTFQFLFEFCVCHLFFSFCSLR